MDPRVSKLAYTLVHYSTRIEEGEKVLISYSGASGKPLVKEIIKEVYNAGGYPYVEIVDSEINRELIKGCCQEQLDFQREYEMAQMKGMDAYISIRCPDNISELSDIPADIMNLYSKALRPVTDCRVSETKWVVLRYPNASMAQLSNTSLESFEDFYFDVCNLDYSKMSDAMDALADLMAKTDMVRITGPGTDISFSIKDIGSVKCDGGRNIPDGEIYSAPRRFSVNGQITYNTPSTYQGFTFENIRFVVKNGQIVEATANDNIRINKLLNTDPGARYFGEFAIGVNPYILHPMKDTLFDEKICGSIHLTPGRCYDSAFNGNLSSIHWDLVLIQREEYGGGEIWFDDVLIRKDGIFVLPELECLNPENLK
ncbi:MAG: aminopeptidase [Firmicutes bacterium]|nr:aminopeptidase [Bacillota bacterium]